MKKEVKEWLRTVEMLLQDIAEEITRFVASRWNGPCSLRIQVRGLYFGGAWRENCRAIWVIYNGRPFSWQIQTWRPRIAIWK